MATATQTFAANGTNWGSAWTDSTAGPSYAIILSSVAAARSSFFGGAQKYRAIWELDMAVLVADGYIVGTPITEATLSMTVATRTGAAAGLKPGIINNTITDAAATVFANVDPSNCQGAADAFSGAGAKTLTFDSTVRDLIAGLGATDKRLIAFPLAVEGSGGQMVTDASVACVLTIEFEPPGSSTGALFAALQAIQEDELGAA